MMCHIVVTVPQRRHVMIVSCYAQYKRSTQQRQSAGTQTPPVSQVSIDCLAAAASTAAATAAATATAAVAAAAATAKRIPEQHAAQQATAKAHSETSATPHAA